MKKLLLVTIIAMYFLFEVQDSSNSMERAIDDSIDLNQEYIRLYESRIHEDNFVDEQYKKNYINNYAGFLHWIINYEYKSFDPEFNRRLDANILL